MTTKPTPPWFRTIDRRRVGDQWIFDAVDLEGRNWTRVVPIRSVSEDENGEWTISAATPPPVAR